MQKGSGNTSIFRFLAGWLLEERKKSKIDRGKHKKCYFLKIANNNPLIGFIHGFRGLKNGKILYDILALYFIF